MKKAASIFVILAVVIAAGSFYGGILYQKGQATLRAGNGGFGGAPGTMRGYGQNGDGMNRPGFPGGDGSRPVSGKITKVEDDSITIKTEDGSSKIVLLGSSTEIGKFSKGSAGDLKTGEQAMVIGKTNSDGSVTATVLQLGNQPMRFGRQGSPGQAAPGQSDQTMQEMPGQGRMPIPGQN